MSDSKLERDILLVSQTQELSLHHKVRNPILD